MASAMGNRSSRSGQNKVSDDEAPRNLHEHLIKQLKKHGKQVAQVDAETGETVTFEDILERSSALAAGLRARGLRPGSVAVVMGENSIFYPEVLIAVLRTGAAAHLIDPRGTPYELEHAISITRPHLVLLSKFVASAQGVLDVLSASTCVHEVLVWGGGTDDIGQLPDGVGSLHNLLVSPAKSASSSSTFTYDEEQDATGQVTKGTLSAGAAGEVTSTPANAGYRAPFSEKMSPALQELLPRPVDGVAVEGGTDNVDSTAVALILMSSGSTGLPKGVTLTHANVLAALKLGPTFIQPDDVVLGLSPYFHAYGGMLMIMSLCQGAREVAVSRFSLEGLVQTVERHKVTVMHVVPSLVVSLTKYPCLEGHRMSSLKRVWTGAALVSPLVQHTIRQRLPGVTLYHSYGMTETTFVTMNGECRADKPGSPGTLTPGMECKIVDPDSGKAVSGNHMGVLGELCFRGPMVMRGYLNNAEATREALDDEGWLHSGDLGYVDEDGYYFIKDRLKDILKFNGHQVAPSELESLLLTHPAVRDAAVIGLPHEYGDAPHAVVILAEGATATDQELQAFLNGKVAPYKMLRGGVRFTQSPFPKTASGKLQRRKLRNLLLGDVSISSSEDSFSSESTPADTASPQVAAAAELGVESPQPDATPAQPSVRADATFTKTVMVNGQDIISPMSGTSTTPATPFENFFSAWTPVSETQSTLSTPDTGAPTVSAAVAASVPLPPSVPNSPACVEVPYVDSPMTNCSARSMSICSIVSSPIVVVTPPQKSCE